MLKSEKLAAKVSLARWAISINCSTIIILTKNDWKRRIGETTKIHDPGEQDAAFRPFLTVALQTCLIPLLRRGSPHLCGEYVKLYSRVDLKLTQYKRSEISLQGHIISRGVYHSNRSGEQIMRRKVHRNLHTAHLTVNVDKFHSILTAIQKFQTLLKHTRKILACSTVKERKSSWQPLKLVHR